MKAIVKTIYEDILSGRNDEVQVSLKAAIQEGVQAAEILNVGLIEAMDEVGRRFEAGEYYVPEMLISARAMKAGLEILRPYLVEEGVEPRGKAVIGTVQGDLHDIGKNLVGMMLEGAGFEVVDLGTDVPPERFAEAARLHQADIIGVSALLTTTMQNMPHVIEAVEDIGLRNAVKIFIGGAPVTSSFADEIEADGYAPDASSAATLVKSLFPPNEVS
jgi:5-methyltetrahydrofolate--homocysteine methyltransferase